MKTALLEQKKILKRDYLLSPNIKLDSINSNKEEHKTLNFQIKQNIPEWECKKNIFFSWLIRKEETNEVISFIMEQGCLLK